MNEFTSSETVELVPSYSNRSASVAKLAAALAKAQMEMEGAAKDATNPHFKSKYADLASVREACRPLSKHGIAILQPTRADGANVTVTTLLVHDSGEWISEDLTLTAQQATPQAVGSAITYGRRYGLAAMVGIAPEDDDGNAASQPAARQQAQPTVAAIQAAKPDGYDKWLPTYQASAKKGLEALRKAYKDAPPACRDYLTRHDAEAYNKARADAETFTKNEQAVPA